MSASDKQLEIKKAKSSAMMNVFLRFPRAMKEIAKVSDFGNSKYNAPPGDMAFLEEGTFNDYTDALGRHLLDEVLEGPFNRADGGLLHAAQAAWNALARLEKRLMDPLGVEDNGVIPADQVEWWPKEFDRNERRGEPKDTSFSDDVDPSARRDIRMTPVENTPKIMGLAIKPDELGD